MTGKSESLATLAWGIIFVTVPIFLVLYQSREIEGLLLELETDRMNRQARRILDTEQRSSLSDLRVRGSLTDFTRTLGKIVWNDGIDEALRDGARLHETNLRAAFPPHELFLVRMSREKISIGFHFVHGKLPKWKTGPFPAERFTRVFSPSVGASSDPYLTEWILKNLENPILSTNGWKSSWRGDFKTFLGKGARWGVFWDILPVAHGGSGLFIVAIVDLTRVRVGDGPRAVVKGWGSPDFGIAFLPERKGLKPVLSRFFRGKEALTRRFRSAMKGNDPLRPFEKVDDFLIWTGNFSPEVPFRVVLAASPKERMRGSRLEMGIVWGISGVFWCLGIILLVERVLFRRGPAVSVKRFLLGTFISAAILPIIWGIGPGSRFLSDRSRTERRQAAERLGDDLNAIDGGGRFFQSRYVQAIRGIARDPAVVSRGEFLCRGLPGDSSRPRVVSFLADLVKKCEAKVPRPQLRNLILVGPGNFSGIWSDIPGGAPIPEKGLTGANLVELAIRNLMEENRAFGAGKVEAPSAARFMGKETRSDLVYDAFLRYLLDNLGGAAFSSFIHYPMGVTEVRLEGFRANWMATGCFSGGLMKFILYWVWRGDGPEGAFLERRLGNAPPRSGVENALFATEQREVSRPSGEEYMSYPAGLAAYPSLVETALGARESRTPHRGYSETEQRLYEARPGRYLTRHILAGFASTKAIEEEVRSSWRRFLIVSLVMVVLASLVAFGAADHFLAPLEELLRKIDEVKSGDFTARVLVDREDEFGALATAFNGMAGKLQEGAFLGRFVSGFVKKALEDPVFLDEARRGKRAGVTVLFSNLVGFPEFGEKASPAKVFEVLEGHLAVVDRAVKRSGGEIDKIIGEKILLLFPHRDFGSAGVAGNAALSVAAEIRSALSRDFPLPPAIGITSGEVLMGILGARGVRVDYTAIGDTVNLAARLATLAQITTGTRTVVSGSFLQVLDAMPPAEKLPFKKVKGKTQEVEAYLLLA